MKDYRFKEMKVMLLADFLLFLLWSTTIFEQFPETPENNYKYIISIMEGVTISGVLSLLTFLGDSLISKFILRYVGKKNFFYIFIRIKIMATIR